MKRFLFSTAILLWLTGGFTCSAITSGRSLQKTYTWSYKVNAGARVVTDNYDCDLVIHTWDKDEVEYRLSVDMEARSDEDAEALESYLSGLVFSHSATNVSLDNRFWDNRNTVLGRMTMKLKNGKNISLISFDMRGELWIPKGCSFAFSSKYSEINMEDFSGPVQIALYNDKFYGGDLGGRAELSDKYSTIVFKDIRDMDATLYNSRLDGGNCGNLNINSKYSKITFKTSGDLKIDGYNDKYSFLKTGDIAITAKYTDLKAEAAGKTDVIYYEGTVDIGSVKDITVKSKYADYKFDVAGNCRISSSYNDRLTVGKLTSLAIGTSKYCNYKIDNLSEFLTENEGYNDKIGIGVVGENFSKFSVNGKYLEVSLGLPGNMDYRFKANITYADLKINESALKPKVRIEKGSQLEYDAVKGTEREGMPLVEANGYQVSVRVREM